MTASFSCNRPASCRRLGILSASTLCLRSGTWAGTPGLRFAEPLAQIRWMGPVPFPMGLIQCSIRLILVLLPLLKANSLEAIGLLVVYFLLKAIWRARSPKDLGLRFAMSRMSCSDIFCEKCARASSGVGTSPGPISCWPAITPAGWGA